MNVEHCLIALLGLMAGVGGVPSASAQPLQEEPEVARLDARQSRFAARPGEVLVKFRDSSPVAIKAPSRQKFSRSNSPGVDELFSQLGVQEVEQLMPSTGTQPQRRQVRDLRGNEMKIVKMDKAFRLIIKPEANTLDVIAKLRGLPEVEYAEPNYLVETLAFADGSPSDAMRPDQWALDAINMPALWQQPVINPRRPVIAILDTGVDIEHPDLADNIWTNPRDSEDGLDNDGNDYIDDIHGWNFVYNSNRIYDHNGHGTHCAGIAAACGDNAQGVIGANPDALIMPVMVLNTEGQGDLATIIRGIDYAAFNGADILSMSFGGYGQSAIYRDALAKAYQDCILVAAAGNDGLCMNHFHSSRLEPAPMFPAAYPFVLGVQASAQNGNLAGFSNYDDDGPFFSSNADYNYEMTAPGVSVLSTFPDGQYTTLNGTSMAAPLVAGAISRLRQCKDYGYQEEMWGDIIAGNTGGIPPVFDVFACYGIDASNRTPQLALLSLEIDDSEGDGDGRLDAGETVKFYPVVKNVWGEAKNIKVSMAVDESQMPKDVDVVQGTANFGHTLSGYAQARSEEPIILKIADTYGDDTPLRMYVHVTCEGIDSPKEQFATFTVENAVELKLYIDEDMTLHEGINYVCSQPAVITDSATLTIEPGAKILFRDKGNITVKGNMIAVGKPGKMITFQGEGHPDMSPYFIIYGHGTRDQGIYLGDNIEINTDTLSTEMEWKFCRIIGLSTNGRIFSQAGNWPYYYWTDSQGLYHQLYGSALLLSDCVFKDNYTSDFFRPVSINRSSVLNHICYDGSLENNSIKSNICGLGHAYDYSLSIIFGEIRGDWKSCNIIGNYPFQSTEDKDFPYPSYWGSSREDIVRKGIMDIYSGDTPYKFDLSNMLTEPVRDAHGIVWKVAVDGKDAQDEFEQMLPLGIGKHKFEVYFNRPMNTAKAPNITMGVRDPWRSTVIREDGAWSADSTIYTAYLTLDGRNAANGTNRILVEDAEDDEFFEIPRESSRFNVIVEAAGSMSAGFEAEAGLGRVNLHWQPADNQFDDLMGYNLYRFQLADPTAGTEIGDDGNPTNAADLQRLNEKTLQTTEFQDVNVEVWRNYYYFFKVMRTDMTSSEASKIVYASPATSVAGDANASGDVTALDVVATANHIIGRDVRPFIFEAADMSGDGTLTSRDITGIVKVLVGKDYAVGAPAKAAEEAGQVEWYVTSDGALFLRSTGQAIASVQIDADVERGASVAFGPATDGFERAYNWLDDTHFRAIIYSLDLRALPTDQWIEVLRFASPCDHAFNVSFIEFGTAMASELPSQQVDDPEAGNRYTLGDANIDGDVNVGDVMIVSDWVVNWKDYSDVVGLSADGQRMALSADVNADQLIDVADVSGIVVIVLDADNPNRMLALNRRFSPYRLSGDNLLSARLAGEFDGISTYAINLSNADRLVNGQFDLELSEGMELVGVRTANRADNHEVSFGQQGNKARILLLSLENAEIADNSGAVVLVDVRGRGPVALSNALFTLGDATPVDVVCESTTGVEAVGADIFNGTEEYYNPAGQRVAGPQSGVTILRLPDGSARKLIRR